MQQSKRNNANRRNKNEKPISTKKLMAKLNEIENTLMETKWFDSYDLTESIRTSPASLYHITPVAQGDQPYNRNGDQLAITDIQLRWSATIPVAGVAVPAFLRRIIFVDRQANMTAPSAFTTGGDQSALLETVITGVPAFLAPFNYLAKDRYRILSDKTFKFNNLNAMAGATFISPLHEELNLKIQPLRVKYGSSAATYPVTNSVFVYFMSSVVAAVDAPDLQFSSRILFKDA